MTEQTKPEEGVVHIPPQTEADKANRVIRGMTITMPAWAVPQDEPEGEVKP